MTLILEAFSARHGDALLLHYGTKDQPRLAMIDGGPKGVYKKVIQPRLRALSPSEGAAPRIRWANVSHVDEDHITGVIALFDGIATDAAAPAVVDGVFHNVPTPGDALRVATGSTSAARLSERDRLELELARLIDPTRSAGVRVESFQQGAELTNLARDIHVPRNPAKGKRLLTGDALPAKFVKPLSVTVVAPSLQHFRDLIDKWRAELGESGGVRPSAAKRHSIDTSVSNLSSLVLLVKQGPKKILLTGDARADHILDGLSELGVLDDNGKPFIVDVLKLPHHGSDRTMDLDDNVPSLLERVRAKHYVISADGRYDNPSADVLRKLVRAQGERACTVWFTTPERRGGTYGPVFDKAVAALRREIRKTDANIRVEVPATGQTSQMVSIER